jgi:hypothetical protein
MADMHMMLGADGKVVMADLEPVLRRFRGRHVAARADAVTELAGALGEECFDPEEVWDCSALPDALKNAAADVALVLLEVERLRQ